MNLSGPIDAQRHTVEMAAEIIEKTDASAENLPNLLAAEVGQTDSEVVYEENKLELHHYEPDEKLHETPIFVVYALVNRPYILDLQPDRSVIRRLLEHGYEVYMIEWGEPSLLDRTLTLDDYVNRYIKNCADEVCEQEGVDDLHVLGYCMGGTMSLMYTISHPETVRTLSLMATPFVFEGTGGILEHWATFFAPDAVVDAMGNVPAELLAVTFSMMNPVDQYVSKYIRLYENIEDEDFVENFARMEQWVWDGVDVAGETFREFINELYKQNHLVKGDFELAGEQIDLERIEVPLQQIVGEYDHIVPAESSKPINDAVSSEDQRLIEFSAGHIGISVSSSAHERLWPDVCDWLAERDVSQEAETEVEADSAEGPGTEATNGHDVASVSGIGPTYAERLEEAGIETVADLREHDPEDLAEIADTYPSRTEGWLDDVA
jgi:polyhydroxyalkanoate synthase